MSSAIPSRSDAGGAPDFLACVSPEDRRPLRSLSFLPMGFAAAVTALAVGLVITLAFAASASYSTGGLVDALQTLTKGDRPGRGLLSYGYEFAVAGLASFAAALVALAIASKIYRRPIRSFLTAAPRFRWPLAVLGLALGAPLVALAFWGERLISPGPLSAPLAMPGALEEKLGYAATAAGCLYLAAFAEEALFRGWLLQQSAAWSRRLPLLLAINGIVFSLVHFDPDPGSFLVRAVMGAGWAWIALRTGGVEFTTGAHLANNLFVALFVMPVTFTAGKAAPADLRPAFIQLGVVLALAAAVEALRRRSRPEA